MAGLRLPTCAKCNGPANGPKDLRPAQFTDLSIDCRVAWLARRWVCGRAGDELVPGMGLCRGKADWPCGVQTVSSRTAQWSGMWPSGLAGKMLCWPLAAMRLYRGKTDWPCSVQTGSSRASQWGGMCPAVFARHDAGLAVGRNAPVPGMRLWRECACAGIRPIGLAACKPEAHARLSRPARRGAALLRPGRA